MHNTNHYYHPSRLLNQSEKSVSVIVDTQTDLEDTYITNIVSAPISIYEPVSDEFIEITDSKNAVNQYFPTTNFFDENGKRFSLVNPHTDFGLTYDSVESLKAALKEYSKYVSNSIMTNKTLREQAIDAIGTTTTTTGNLVSPCQLQTLDDLLSSCGGLKNPNPGNVPFPKYDPLLNPCGWFSASYSYESTARIHITIVCDGNIIFEDTQTASDNEDSRIEVPGYEPDPIYRGDTDPNDPSIGRVNGMMNVGVSDNIHKTECVETYVDQITGEICNKITETNTYCRVIEIIEFSNHCGCPMVPCIRYDQGDRNIPIRWGGTLQQLEGPIKLKELQLIQSTYPSKSEDYFSEYVVSPLPSKTNNPQPTQTNMKIVFVDSNGAFRESETNVV